MCQIFEDLAEKRAEETRIETLVTALKSYDFYEMDSGTVNDSYEFV